MWTSRRDPLYRTGNLNPFRWNIAGRTDSICPKQLQRVVPPPAPPSNQAWSLTDSRHERRRNAGFDCHGDRTGDGGNTMWNLDFRRRSPPPIACHSPFCCGPKYTVRLPARKTSLRLRVAFGLVNAHAKLLATVHRIDSCLISRHIFPSQCGYVILNAFASYVDTVYWLPTIHEFVTH